MNAYEFTIMKGRMKNDITLMTGEELNATTCNNKTSLYIGYKMFDISHAFSRIVKLAHV